MSDSPATFQRRKDSGAAPEPHVDPVCKMLVLPESAAATYEHDGTTYYFCMPGCRDKFAADPRAFLNAETQKRRETQGSCSPPYEGGVAAA